MSEAELFVVCKNCGSEVSPYVTECPYCGQRVRKRAPKLDRGGESEAPRRRRPPSLPRLRRDEIPGIAPETRPYATIVLVTAALVATLVWVAGLTIYDLGAIVAPIGNDWWRLPAYAFVHTNIGSLFATLVATGIFGMHLERRFGPGIALGTFLLGATAAAPSPSRSASIRPLARTARRWPCSPLGSSTTASPRAAAPIAARTSLESP